MAWIEAHQSLRDHRKIIALATELCIPESHAIGLCVALWLWAIDNAPDGTLPSVPRIAERAAFWDGNPGELVAAMIKSGFIDDLEDGMQLHDWHDYAGRLIDKRKENTNRMRSKRATKVFKTKEDVHEMCDARAENMQQTFDARAGATVPYSTVPKEKDKEIDATSASTPISRRYTDDEKAPVAYLKSRLQALGVRDFARDWHLKGYAVSKAMQAHRTSAELMALIDEALASPYWGHRVTDMFRIQDYAKESALRQTTPITSGKETRRPEMYTQEVPRTAEEEIARDRALQAHFAELERARGAG